MSFVTPRPGRTDSSTGCVRGLVLTPVPTVRRGWKKESRVGGKDGGVSREGLVVGNRGSAARGGGATGKWVSWRQSRE